MSDGRLRQSRKAHNSEPSNPQGHPSIFTPRSWCKFGHVTPCNYPQTQLPNFMGHIWSGWSAARKATGTTFGPELDPFFQFVLKIGHVTPDIGGWEVIVGFRVPVPHMELPVPPPAIHAEGFAGVVASKSEGHVTNFVPHKALKSIA